MAAMSQLDLSLDNLAKRLADGYVGTGDAFHLSRIDGAVMAIGELCGADAAAYLKGLIDFHAGDPDAWKAAAAPIPTQSKLAFGSHTSFSSEATYVVDRHDDDDEA